MTAPDLVLPKELEGHELIASVSGGKDSTAMMLALREAGLPFRAVFADTGWEAEETYAYLDYLRQRLDIQIDVVGAKGGMLARAETRAGFSRRRGKWCTIELKIQPIRDYHARVIEETGRSVAAVVGIRADESAKRASMTELGNEAEGPSGFGWWVWRPLIAWKVEDVLAIHHRNRVEIHPLYLRGHNRVGCWPCIFSNKEEVRLIADHDPDRIELIAEYEKRFSDLRVERNAEKTDRYKYTTCSFFEGRKGGVMGEVPSIHDVVKWSRTVHGGRQLPMFTEAPRGGCYRWGLCDPAEPEDAG